MADKRYGGFWRRWFAFAIDQAILYLLSLILLVVGLLARETGGSPGLMFSVETVLDGTGSFALLHMLASLLTAAAYFTWFHGLTGRTPGKMLLGLCVVQASGEPMTPGVAFLRTVGYLISGLFFWLGFLWVAFDGRKQGWHDKIAATVVLRVQRGRYGETSGSPAYPAALSGIPTPRNGSATGLPADPAAFPGAPPPMTGISTAPPDESRASDPAPFRPETGAAEAPASPTNEAMAERPQEWSREDARGDDPISRTG
jgi:uncharacterized RDD family membrane protein YckC